MMNIVQIIFCIGLFSIGSAKVEGWKDIVPLRSTRADVERLLGAAVRPCKNGCHYDTKTEGVFVLYSGEPCTEGEHSRWRIPRDTVLSFSVYPEVKPKLSDLRLDLKKFTKTEDPELHGYFYYSNEEDGVTYAISDRHVVLGIDWFGASKDNNALRCASVGASISTENAKEPVFDPHTSVGLTFGDDKPRLDQFAKNLKKIPNAKAYIIAYGVDLGLAGEARMRLKCIRNYLQKSYHIRPSRLVMIDGGYADKINVELFLVRPGEPKPKPAPTRNLTAVQDIKPRTDPCR